MSDHYLYLTIDLLSVLFPFLFSFHPSIEFYKKWKFLWPALLFPAVFFIGWDLWFTSLGVWGFNPRYISVIYFFNLPVEEVLFFFCIPYACVFSYHSLNKLMNPKPMPVRFQNFITDLLIFGLLLGGAIYHDYWYTVTTSALTGIMLIFIRRIWRPSFMGRFYFVFLFILIPFFLVNGILTGSFINEPVVWYNDHENLGIRLGTIPAEDVFYGMLLLLLNVSIFEFLQKRLTS